MKKPFISVVIPCYCSARTLPAVVDELAQAMAERNFSGSYELILVNDGSPDKGATTRIIAALSACDARIHAVELARNFGQHAAIMAGFAQVKGDIIVCMDDDGQTPPSEVFKLIDQVEAGYDIVYASYGKAKKHSAYRRLGSRFNRWSNEHFMNIPKDLEQTSYFAVKRFAVDNALTYTNPYPFVEGLLFRSVQTYCNVPVRHRAREVGESGYSMGKLVKLWVNGFTSFSVGPLHSAIYLGFLCSIVGFALVLFLIVRKIAIPDINEGWTSIMACILFVGGLLMLMMGLIGEYVGRIYMSLNNAPQYVVRPASDVLAMAKARRTQAARPHAGDAPAKGVGERMPDAAPALDESVMTSGAATGEGLGSSSQTVQASAPSKPCVACEDAKLDADHDECATTQDDEAVLHDVGNQGADAEDAAVDSAPAPAVMVDENGRRMPKMPISRNAASMSAAGRTPQAAAGRAATRP